jgi:hypothetical protein
MADRRSATAAAFYAREGGVVSQWWTVLHPPYTLWHLSYVAIGAALAPELSWATLAVTIAAFFLAVGVAAHALDELNGRPLGTAIGSRTLVIVAALSLTGAVLLGIALLRVAGAPLIPCIAVGVILVLGYNLELFGGHLHTDLAFAAAWGGFPVLVGFLAQAPPLAKPVALGALSMAIAATGLSYAQRCLSTPVRLLRRRVATVDGAMTMSDGTQRALDRPALVAPLEAALKTLSLTMPILAIALLLARVKT